MLEVVEEIIELLEKEKLAIFYGAGLSRDSGVPLADDVYKNILSVIKDEDGNSLLNENIIEKYQQTTPQMEVFLNRLYNDINIKNKNDIFCNLFRFYDFGRPNWNHFMLVELVKSGLVKWILTTNFDRHFERAYGEKIEEEVDILYQHNGAKNGLWKIDVGNKPAYIKLHGCSSEFEKKKIPATISASVAKEENIKAINRWIERVFGGKELVDAILVLGYSCSDAYDILKCINEIGISKKKIYLLVHNEELTNIEPHTRNEIQYVDYENRRKNPFVGFDGFIIHGNTKYFLEQVYMQLKKRETMGDICYKSKPGRKREKSNSIFNEWGEQITITGELNHYYPHQIAFKILYEVALQGIIDSNQKESLLNSAIKHANICKQIAVEKNDRYQVCVQNLQIAAAYKELSCYQASRHYSHEVIQESYSYVWAYWQAKLKTLELIFDENDVSCFNKENRCFLQYMQEQKEDLLLSVRAIKLNINILSNDQEDKEYIRDKIQVLIDKAESICIELGHEECIPDLYKNAAKAYKRLGYESNSISYAKKALRFMRV